MKIIELGTIVTDTASGLKGMLTHLQIAQDRHQFYSFQPRGLHSETGDPVTGQWITEPRVKRPYSTVEVDIPLSVLGTECTDEASGFTGVITEITLHISGCIHVWIQPEGKNKKGEMAKGYDFDIRRCKGKAITALSKTERKAQEKSRPSPSPTERYAGR